MACGWASKSEWWDAGFRQSAAGQRPIAGSPHPTTQGRIDVSEILIRGGTIVDGTGGPRYAADLRVRDGRIAEIGPGLGTGGETIDAGGLLVIPGIIDPHTQLDGQLFWAPAG